MTRPSDNGCCDLCGEPMPDGEEMFRLHGYSGPCPKPPLSPLAATSPGKGESDIAVALRLLREARAHLGGAKMSTLARSPRMLCNAIDEFVADGGAAPAKNPVAWIVRSPAGKVRACWWTAPTADQREFSEMDGDTITPLFE